MYRSCRMYGRGETCIQSFWLENPREGYCPVLIAIEEFKINMTPYLSHTAMYLLNVLMFQFQINVFFLNTLLST
jgi:hypothetical protein